MDDRDRDREVDDLRQQLSRLKSKRAALVDECIHLAAWLPEIRKQFGNSFYYSNPTEPDEGIANYNAKSSYPGSQTLSDLMRVDRELERIKTSLRRLGALG